MTDLTRIQLIDTLNGGWATYVARYRALSPGDRQQWLAAQGYLRFSDLLAHIVAWWLDGQDREFTSVTFLLDRFGRVRGIHPGGRFAPGDRTYGAIRRGVEALLTER